MEISESFNSKLPLPVLNNSSKNENNKSQQIKDKVKRILTLEIKKKYIDSAQKISKCIEEKLDEINLCYNGEEITIDVPLDEDVMKDLRIGNTAQKYLKPEQVIRITNETIFKIKILWSLVEKISKRYNIENLIGYYECCDILIITLKIPAF